MKQIFALFVFISSITFADNHKTVTDLPICDITSLDSERLHDIFIHSLEDVIFLFPEGMKFPVRFFVKGDLFSLSMKDEKPLVLQFNQKTYVKFVFDNPLISLDLENWVPICKLVDKKHELSISTFGEIPVGELTLDLNIKK